MMYHTEAVIIAQSEWGESDLFVTVLARDFGKIRLVAQGARKHGAKLQGHLEPGTESAISFVVGRNGYRLTTASAINSFPGVRVSLSKLRAFSGILRALDLNVYEERDNARELYELVIGILGAIDGAHRLGTVRRCVAWFYVRFFAFLGILPGADAPEAVRAQNLFRIGASSLADLDRFPIREASLASELSWLSGHLARNGSGHEAVAMGDFGLY